MKFWDKLRKKRARRLAIQAVPEPQVGDLREFVYLDDTSVQSLLASLTGAIDQETVESREASLTAEIESEIGARTPVVSAGLSSKLASSNSSGSQTLRKSIAQSRFKTLYEKAAESMALHPNSETQVSGNPSQGELTALVAADPKYGIETKDLRRGDLIELQIELEADSTFRMQTAIAAVFEILDQGKGLPGIGGLEDLSEARAVGNVLSALMTGLVPLRSRVIGKKFASIGGQEMILNTDERDAVDYETSALRPIYLAGVAERDLFWKDLRRVLFSGQKFTALCRVSRPGLHADWNPIKIFDALRINFPVVARQLEDSIREFGLTQIDSEAFGDSNGDLSRAERLVVEYTARLVREAGFEGAFDSAELPPGMGVDIESYEGRKDALAQARASIEQRMGELNISPERDAQLRTESYVAAGIAGPPDDVRESELSTLAQPATDDGSRIIDCEIVAIYW